MSNRPTRFREVVLLLSFLALYSLVRQVADDDVARAVRHARTILAVERDLGMDLEAGLNARLTETWWVQVMASYWYSALHYVVTPLVLALSYRHRPAEYRRARTALVLATTAALIGYLGFPTAPPRLLPG